MYAQQPLGVLGIDAAKLGEHSHDLQEQEPAGQPEERLGCSPPLPPPTGLGTALKLHKVGGFNLRTFRVSQEKGSVEFPKLLVRPVDEKGDLRHGPAPAFTPHPLGLSPSTRRCPQEHPGIAGTKCIGQFGGITALAEGWAEDGGQWWWEQGLQAAIRSWI